MTCRTRGISLPQLIEDLTPYLIGWRGYFGFCQTPRVLTNLEAWIRRRLRLYLWRQWQNGHNRFNELRRRGVPRFNALDSRSSPYLRRKDSAKGLGLNSLFCCATRCKTQ
jgi:RNA-directed DNA polymerase